MLPSILLSAVLAVGQSAGAPPTPNAPGGPPDTPCPSGRTFADLPPEPPPAAAPAPPPKPAPSLFTAMDNPPPGEPVGLLLPSTLFPSPAAAPAPAAPAEQRRAMPSPFLSPPLPGSEFQGYPIIGLPSDFTIWPLQQALQGTALNTALIDHKIRVYGWITAEANLSTSKQSNTPDSYWIRPNNVDVDQVNLRFERNPDTVQTDHIDFGFRSTFLYGIDYRYMTAGGWFSDQLLVHNHLYGFDPTEQYVDMYVPWVFQGMIIRVGRWVACPDIETQFAPDNYMGSHSLLFTYDTYTQTGVMTTFMINKQVTIQAAINAGTDMAPWYTGSLATGAVGIRLVSKSNNDAFYGWLNAINNAEFRYYQKNGQLVGHDNFNYWVQTWEHKFSQVLSTKTESYIMWQKNAVVGGTPSIGPVESFGSGGGIGAFIPGTTYTFGALNFTEYVLGRRDFITVRNEYWKDTDGERAGFKGVYTSNAIGWSHNFSPYFQIRPEIDYFRNWTVPAFDNGRRQNQFMLATDVTLRF